MKRLKVILYLSILMASSANAAIASTVAIAAANASANHQRKVNQEQQQIQRQNVDSKNLIIRGVMQCEPSYISIRGPQAYDMYGCVSNGRNISIEKFFKKNARNSTYEIASIIYNDHANRFLIYYGVKKD